MFMTNRQLIQFAAIFGSLAVLAIKVVVYAVVIPMKKRYTEATKTIDSTYRRFQSIESRELKQIRNLNSQLSRELAEQRQLNAELRELLRKQSQHSKYYRRESRELNQKKTQPLRKQSQQNN